MNQKIQNIENKLQELFDKMDFKTTLNYGVLDVHKLSHIMLSFTTPANEIIQNELKDDDSEEFKKEVCELIKRFRIAIAVKYSS